MTQVFIEFPRVFSGLVVRVEFLGFYRVSFQCLFSVFLVSFSVFQGFLRFRVQFFQGLLWYFRVFEGFLGISVQINRQIDRYLQGLVVIVQSLGFFRVFLLSFQCLLVFLRVFQGFLGFFMVLQGFQGLQFRL